MEKEYSIETIASKSYLDGEKKIRPLSPSVSKSTVFAFPSSELLGEGYVNNWDNVYTRFGNPTLSEVSNKIAELEGAKRAMVFSSGMSAITTSILAVIKKEDHIIVQREIFAQTYTFFNEFLKSWGLEISFVKAREIDTIENLIKPNTRLIYIESPSNPILEIVDIEKMASISKAHKIKLFIDSTFASPYCQNPILLGVDLVIHSATKFLGGHNDILAGAVAGSSELLKKIYEMSRWLGGIMDPQSAYELHRSIKTLPIRMKRICENAFSSANFLSSHEKVIEVRYPLLKGGHNYSIAKKQMTGGGGVITFDVGSLKNARILLDNFQLITIATSLGGVETVVEIPYELDFAEREIGTDTDGEVLVSPGFIRMSVGIENVDDLISGLKCALYSLN